MIRVYIFFTLLIIICISSWFIKKKAGKIIFIISIILLVVFILMFHIHNIAFFFDSLKYQKYTKYDYSNDIKQYGHITENGAIKIAQEDTDSTRIAQVESELKEVPILKDDGNDYFKSIYNDYFKSLYGEEKLERMKNVTKYWSINFVTGWDSGCKHYEEHIFIIDYYTGEIFEHLQTD